jgi:hypothetical protein
MPLLNYKGAWNSPETPVSSNVLDNSHPNQFPFLNLQSMIASRPLPLSSHYSTLMSSENNVDE